MRVYRDVDIWWREVEEYGAQYCVDFDIDFDGSDLFVDSVEESVTKGLEIDSKSQT